MKRLILLVFGLSLAGCTQDTDEGPTGPSSTVVRDARAPEPLDPTLIDARVFEDGSAQDTGDAGVDTDGAMDAGDSAPLDLGSRAVCSDGIDNDGDGRTDYPADPGCEDAADGDETDIEPRPECDDGIDNDDDGAIDTFDSNCADAEDPTERGSAQETACANGLDDDDDGFIDFPDDPGCAGAGDTGEADLPMEPACNNGVDDDEDGLQDYPMDPGCVGRGDDDETTPTPRPACANGADDDGNGLTDYPEDLGCTSAGDFEEASPCGAVDPVDLKAHLAENEFYDGTLTDLEDELIGSCGGRAGGETVFVYMVDRLIESITFTTANPETEAPTVLYARAECTAAEDFDCDRGNAENPGATITIDRPALGPLFIVVDTGSRNSVGAFRLSTVIEYPPQCRDGFDNDEDGTIDADDIGCAELDDDDETDPDELPICSNRIDDDMDGATDYPRDPDCITAGFDREQPLCDLDIPFVTAGQEGGRFNFEPAAEGAMSLARGSCSPGIGPEGVVVLTLDDPSRVELDVTVNGVRTPASIYVRTDCEDPASEVGCRVEGPNEGTLLFDNLDRGIYYVMVEHPQNGASGFTVELAVESNIRECNDLIDNDNDGRVDLNDIGCVEGLDDSEADPAEIPQCGDMIDNDGDGDIDYPADDGCTGAGDTRETPLCMFTENIIEVPANGGVFPYNTAGQPSAGRARCGGGGPQQVAAITLNRASAVTFTIEANQYDPLIHLRSVCDDPNTELACNDDFNGLASQISSPRLEPGTYFLFMDGFAGQAGAATLRVTVNPL